MKNFFQKLAIVATIALTLASCKKDKDAPANEISDPQGISVKLNWSMDDGTNAFTGADLDFYIYKGVGGSREVSPIVIGDNMDSYEDMDFLNDLADGDYSIDIDYYQVAKNGKFNLDFKAKGSESTYSFDNNVFTTGNNGQTVPYAKITKAGGKYSFSKL